MNNCHTDANNAPVIANVAQWSVAPDAANPERYKGYTENTEKAQRTQRQIPQGYIPTPKEFNMNNPQWSAAIGGKDKKVSKTSRIFAIRMTIVDLTDVKTA
jgi:hypothetical protein